MNKRLKQKKKPEHLVLSLFTGAGGLDLGLEYAGFCIKGCIEADDDSRKTLTKNNPSWTLTNPGDIFRIHPSELLSQVGLQPGETALLSCGPPCQPFSKSTYWFNGTSAGLRDPRTKTLQAFLNVVEVALPRVILLENVKGISWNAYGRQRSGLELIKDGIERINRKKGTEYKLQDFYINSADYGVPQIRKRIFIVADINGKMLDMPSPICGYADGLEPYRNSWDAIGDLDTNEWSADLQIRGKWKDLIKSIPEGKNYLWHTHRGNGTPLFGWRTKYWSFLLKLSKRYPSWTIQASPGPASGPFHWRNRLLSIKEISRLQTFPDGYEIYGNRSSAHRQVGNAVPCLIGELFGLEIRRQLLNENCIPLTLRLMPPHREDCPPPSRCYPVIKKYLYLKGNHSDHPGVGRGPRSTVQNLYPSKSHAKENMI